MQQLLQNAGNHLNERENWYEVGLNKFNETSDYRQVPLNSLNATVAII